MNSQWKKVSPTGPERGNSQMIGSKFQFLRDDARPVLKTL
jgi:hypothetical protein